MELKLKNGGFIRFSRIDHLFQEYIEYDAEMGKADPLESFKIGWKEFLGSPPKALSPNDILILNTGAHWTKRAGKASGTVVSGVDGDALPCSCSRSPSRLLTLTRRRRWAISTSTRWKTWRS